jgi:hypothetical protein
MTGRSDRLIRFTCIILILATGLLASGPTAYAQTPTETYQRNYPNSPDELQKAVQTVRSITRGRLPILDGFVVPQGQPLESYSRGYYETTLTVLPAGSGQGIVRAAAKITAWYTDPDASRSGYRVLPSNGRLENDALDRIDEVLAGGTGNDDWSSSSSSVKSSGAAPSAGGIRPSAGNLKPFSAVGSSPPANDPTSTESTETIAAQREVNERKARELTVEETNLEEIQRNQARPTDLIAVKKSSTPVFSRPAEGAQVLMSAEAHDEFQILGIEGAWVHVQISGASRGWLRRSQVDMPASYGGFTTGNEAETPQPAPATDRSATFRIEKEQTTPFSGKWDPLNGKNVRVVWVAPSSPSDPPTSARQKKTFAKEIFLRSYAEGKSATPPIDGVVVLFDSADGGQVAATNASLSQLADGSLGEAAFWKQCLLDPPELFQDAAKTSAKLPVQRN